VVRPAPEYAHAGHPSRLHSLRRHTPCILAHHTPHQGKWTLLLTSCARALRMSVCLLAQHCVCDGISARQDFRVVLWQPACITFLPAVQ
jgi:hypothetical protein